jgi:hypothetical protein
MRPMTDRDDRERESRATGETRWEEAGEEDARRRREAAERLRAENAERERERDRDDPGDERERPGLGGDAA